ncbi:MAG: hypothetical protein E6R03_13975 [Hyphomicrobiaceae bacterium]|nr:MAG: hypothetical protein E6R03_13975 [Hyphomicrobiaceae bacterium]
MRILITGGPRTGKTVLAVKLSIQSGLQVFHTDDLIDVGWSEASANAAEWMEQPGPWVIEGVSIPRALRKWLAAHPEGKPADKIIYLSVPRVELSSGQAAMAKGVATVWREVVPELVRRGVEIVFDPDPDQMPVAAAAASR